MFDKVFKEAKVINRGTIEYKDVGVKDGRIVKIANSIESGNAEEVRVEGKILMPGIIDDQVHFRQPGLEYKADIKSESRAAVAGGTTTFMEMPNTKPPALTIEELEKKYTIAQEVSPANYSFFMGASNDNIEEIKKVDKSTVCGVKIFMGSSTGNMLVDNDSALEAIFTHSPMLIATHCEDEATIRENQQYYTQKYGEQLEAIHHPQIRSREGCYLSSAKAIELAKSKDARLHILHISTEDETHLFRNDIPLGEKRITSEVCVHHLSYNADDYARLGNQIKCNPAIKYQSDQEALWKALLDDRFDIIATDHAPHTWEEKSKHYSSAPSGVPLVQHSLNLMLNHFHAGRISLERIIEKMCHAPAECFQLADRGYIDEGYFADLVIVDEEAEYKVDKSNILYKCGWSPLEGQIMKGTILKTFVNGHCVYQNGIVSDTTPGMRCTFNRNY